LKNNKVYKSLLGKKMRERKKKRRWGSSRKDAKIKVGIQRIRDFKTLIVRNLISKD